MKSFLKESFHFDEKWEKLEDQSNFYTVLLFVLIRIWERYFGEYVVFGVLLALLSIINFIYAVRLIRIFINNKRKIENYKRRLIFLYFRLLFNGILVSLALYSSILSFQNE